MAEDTSQLMPERKMSWADMVDEEEELQLAQDEQRLQSVTRQDKKRKIPPIPYLPVRTMGERRAQTKARHEMSKASGTFPHPCTPPSSMDEDRFNLLSLHDDPPSQSRTRSFTPVWFKDKRVHPVSRQDISSRTLHGASSNRAPSSSRSMEEGIEFIYRPDDLPRKPHPRSNTPLWFKDEGSEESLEFIYRPDDPPSKSRPRSSTPEWFKDEKIAQRVSRDGTSSRALQDSTSNCTPSRRRDKKIQLMSRDDTSSRGLQRPSSHPTPSRRKDEKMWSNDTYRKIPPVTPVRIMDEKIPPPVLRDGTPSRALQDSISYPTPSRHKDEKIQLMSRDDTSSSGLQRPSSHPTPSRRKDEKIEQPIWSNDTYRKIPPVTPVRIMDEKIPPPVLRDGTLSRALQDSISNPTPSRRKDEKMWSNDTYRRIPPVTPVRIMDEMIPPPVLRDGTLRRALQDSTSNPTPSRRKDEKIQLMSTDDTSSRGLQRPSSHPTPSRRKDEKMAQLVSRDETSSRALQDSTSTPTLFRRKDEKMVQLVSRDGTPGRALQDSTSTPTPSRRKDEKMVQLVSRDGTSSRALQDSTSTPTPSRRKDEKMAQLVSRDETSSRALQDSTSNPTPSRRKDEKIAQPVSNDGTSSRALQDSTLNPTPSRREVESVEVPSLAHSSQEKGASVKISYSKVLQANPVKQPAVECSHMSGMVEQLKPSYSSTVQGSCLKQSSSTVPGSSPIQSFNTVSNAQVSYTPTPSSDHRSQEKEAFEEPSCSMSVHGSSVGAPSSAIECFPMASAPRQMGKFDGGSPQIVKQSGQLEQTVPQKYPTIPRGSKDGKERNSQEPQEEQSSFETSPSSSVPLPKATGSSPRILKRDDRPRSPLLDTPNSAPGYMDGKEQKSQEPKEEQSSFEPSPSTSGAVPKATGRSARISKRGGRHRRSALLDTPSSAPGCMEGKVQKSPEPQEVQVEVESSPRTSGAIPKATGRSTRISKRGGGHRRSALLDTPSSAPGYMDGKEQKSREPKEEQSSFEPSPSTSGAIPKATGSSTEILKRDDRPRRSPLLDTPNSAPGCMEGKVQKSPEPQEVQVEVESSPRTSGAIPKATGSSTEILKRDDRPRRSPLLDTPNSAPGCMDGKEQKSQEPKEEQSSFEPSPSSSGAIPKATGRSARISKRGGGHRRSALLDTPSSAPGCMDGKEQKSQEPKEEQSAVEPTPSTSGAIPKATGSSPRILKRDDRPRRPPLLDTPNSAPGCMDGKIGKSQEPNEEQSAVEPSPSTSGAIPKTTGSSVQILKHVDQPRRSPLLDTPNSLAECLAALMGGPSTSSDANRFTWGNVDEQVSIMSILKGELRNIQSFREDLKTIADDKESFYVHMNEKLKDALVIFDTHKEIAVREDKVAYWKTRGLLFMESPYYAQFAVDAFTKAVKLDPSAVDCWNNLGDCYSVLADYEMSRKCFLSALEQERNVVSLQNLSILSRLKQPREREDYLAGINYAKEALSFDFSSTKSWSILGNAYMAGFFAAGQDEQYIRKALHSYRQADKMGNEDVDLCLNKFVALKYLELYDEALNTVLPSLTHFSMEWKDAQTKCMGLMQYLNSIQELVTKKGKVRPKKRSEHIKRLLAAKPSEEERAAQTTPSPRLSGVVIWILTPDLTYPYTMGLLIESDEVLVVTVFNICRGKGFKIGDIINVPTDNKSEVEFCACQHEFKFTKIRVFLPTDIILNGKRLSVKVLNPYEITSSEGDKKE